MDIHKAAYQEEANELLTELEASLLELEETPDDMELIGRVFRAMHTIKGSGAMFGFDDIAEFTHDVETFFDLVRAGEIHVTKQIINLTLQACDQIRKMVEGETIDKGRSEHILSGFREIMQKPSSHEEKPAEIIKEEKTREATYRIRFYPNPQILATGGNPLFLMDELKELGRCRITARPDRIPILENLDPITCQMGWDILLTTKNGVNEIRDVFIFVEDGSDISIEEIDSEDIEDDVEYRPLGQILVGRGEISSDGLNQILGEKVKIGELIVASRQAEPEAVESALVEQEYIRDIRKKRQETVAASSIRVAADKLDKLVDLVGELVTVQARLTQKASVQNDSELVMIAEEVERLTADLRDNAMGIRMLPIGTTFSKFKRLVRDLSDELGKSIEMITEGGDTELDKTVIERLSDPLVHIIRNSIDHGIEQADIRKSTGKPAHGTVKLSAEHRGTNVLIKIKDDGAGLDAEAIKKKGIEKGLIDRDADLPEKEIFSLIFNPGFSTAKEITDVSGRGVGMDVVKKSIEALRGTIEIESVKGGGTTITLKLPLTLAIIDGLLVEIGTTSFVLPLSVVEECIELTSDTINKAHGRHMATLRGELVPYISLREFFGINSAHPDISQIAIAEVDGSRIGFVVDRVIGQHQTVIKSLGRVYRDVEGVSGATILGDGTIALMLDVNQLSQMAFTMEMNMVNSHH
ncbi:chemotaxis protein CheA [Desulforegula conservatrix]|uniref:chemotaxis protein CheA n=1 Tax=Desulforegula conservatrix TaxID=153026 RepID=UPI00041CAAB3|nr:chemotaxis protein CheA [Desulforegula conservatrix]